MAAKKTSTKKPAAKKPAAKKPAAKKPAAKKAALVRIVGFSAEENEKLNTTLNKYIEYARDRQANPTKKYKPPVLRIPNLSVKESKAFQQRLEDEFEQSLAQGPELGPVAIAIAGNIVGNIVGNVVAKKVAG